MRSLLVFVVLAFAVPAAAQTTVAPMDCADVTRAMQDLLRNDARLRDWPQLERYRMANADLLRAGTRVDVVFLGDSITDAWSNERFGGFFPGKGYINRGISGQTTPQMLVRMKPDVLAFSPKVIVLLAGHERHRRQHGTGDRRRHPAEHRRDRGARARPVAHGWCSRA